MPTPPSPLWKHPNGQWCKKHRGKPYYFGSGSLDDALRRYLTEWPTITAGYGRVVQAATGHLTTRDLCNRFLTHRLRRVESGEMEREVWRQYERVCKRILDVLGLTRSVESLRSDDFGRLRSSMAHAAPTTLTTFIRHVRAVFRFGETITEARTRYGDEFEAPPARTVRRHRADRARRFVPADQLRAIIEKATPIHRAMVLLGINCAFGSTDLSELRAGHLARLDLIVLPRRKTGVERACPLWPETVEAIAAARGARPEPIDPADGTRLFLSPTGRPLKRYEKTTRGDAVADAWKIMCNRAGVATHGGFYCLRHTFRTVADETHDQRAAGVIMGHVERSIAAHYIERVDEKRLAAVTNHVRAWLWPRRSRSV